MNILEELPATRDAVSIKLVENKFYLINQQGQTIDLGEAEYITDVLDNLEKHLKSMVKAAVQRDNWTKVLSKRKSLLKASVISEPVNTDMVIYTGRINSPEYLEFEVRVNANKEEIHKAAISELLDVVDFCYDIQNNGAV